MVKVQILTRCEHCNGEAYLPAGDTESYYGEQYTRYLPCPICQGSGKQTKWVSLREFANLLSDAMNANPMEPNDLELPQKQPTSQFQDSRDATGI